MHPLAMFLPFNRESLKGKFVPARDGAEPPDRQGHWLLIQEQGLFVVEDGRGSTLGLPHGPLPTGFEGKVNEVVWVGTYRGEPCWAGSVIPDTEVPAGFHRETLMPAQTFRNTFAIAAPAFRLTDERFPEFIAAARRASEEIARRVGHIGQPQRRMADGAPGGHEAVPRL